MSAGTLQLFSLRTKLLLFAAVLVLVPGGIYGWITVSQSRAALAHVVGRQLVAEARNVADRLATTLRSEQARFESFALQDVMREIRIGDLDKRIASFLSSAKRGCGACLDLAVLDGEDRVVASSNPVWIGSVGEPSIFGAGQERRIEGPMTPAREKPPVLRFTAPVADPDAPGSSLGRLVALLDWERATDVISRARENLLSVGLDADVLIVDETGGVIGAAVGADGPWQTGDAIGRLPIGGVAVSPAGRIDSAAGMLLGEARLPEDLPPWRVVAAQPFGEAFAAVDR
ncbi:MAG: cache domain-containing protein, partial [Candidatus Binatia bacterium]